MGVPAIAVGLSAISFSATLQKDAAPIPNALAATNTKALLKSSVPQILSSSVPQILSS